MFSMVYSLLNLTFSTKYPLFLLTFQNVLFYYQDKIDDKEAITLKHDVNKNVDINTVTFGELCQFY